MSSTPATVEPRAGSRAGPRSRRPARLGAWLAAASLLGSAWASAQTFPNLPISPAQRDTAQQVAQAGVPLSALAPHAPERHTVRPGDTLWDISALFLRQPWRWPELWGMNLEQIRNPHLILPGQVLVLTRVGERALLMLAQADGPPTVRLSPRIRAEALPEAALPAIPLHAIEPFLTDSFVLSADLHQRAPRIVASKQGQTLLSRGDRVYARGQYGPAAAAEGSALSPGAAPEQTLHIYRNAVPLIDPASGATLGFEVQSIGRAQLVRAESVRQIARPDGPPEAQIEPATLDIIFAQQEIRIGDRLLPAPPRTLPSFVPHAPATAQAGQVIKAQGTAQRLVGQYQVLVLNRGRLDGLEVGHVLALQQGTRTVNDRTDPAQPTLHLPAERNGLMMVFRTFDRVSFALVLEVRDAVRPGDAFLNP